MYNEEEEIFSLEDIQDLFRPISADKDFDTSFLQLYSSYVQNKLETIIRDNPKKSQKIPELKKFLAEHYQFIAGTALDYVAIPDALATKALICIAFAIAAIDAQSVPMSEKKNSLMSILMPGVAYESADERYSNIGEIDLENPERTLDNFEKVLKTHHAVGRYLVPVALLKDYVANPSGDFYCPYYYQEEGEEKYLKLSVNDFKNLFNHSPETQELEEILKARGMPPSSLYASLNTLGQRLKANDANFGTGQELSAGGGMYSPAQTFLDYYAKLESCQFLKVDTEPSVDMLPSDSNMAYALYNGGLYFINRLDSENPIQQVSSEERLSRFPVYLVSTDSLIPEQFAEQFTQRPIIVKNKNQFYFMGESFGPVLLDQKKVLPIYKIFPDRVNKVVPQPLEGIAPSVFDAIFQTGYQSKTFAELLNEKFLENKPLDIDELSWIELQTDHSHLDGYMTTPQDIRKIISDIRKFLIHPYLAYEVNTLGGYIQVNSNIKTCIATLGHSLREKVSTFRENLERLYLASGMSEEIVRQAQESLKVFLSNLSLEGRDQNLKLKRSQLEEITDEKPFIVNSLERLYYIMDADLSEFTAENFAPLVDFDEDELFRFLMVRCPVPVLKILMPFLGSKINLESIKTKFLFAYYSDGNKLQEMPSDFFNNWLCIAKYYVSEVQDLIIFEFTDEQKPLIFECFKDDLARLIKTGRDFDEFLNIFNEEFKAQIIAKVDIRSLRVGDARDLYAILKNIDLPLFQEVLEAHSEKFQGDGLSQLLEFIQTIPQGQAEKLTLLQNLARPTSVEDFLVKISKLRKEKIPSFVDTCCQDDFYNSEELGQIENNALVIANDEQLMACLKVIKPADRRIFFDKVKLGTLNTNPEQIFGIDIVRSEEAQILRDKLISSMVDGALKITNDSQLENFFAIMSDEQRLLFLDKVNLANVQLNPVTFEKLISKLDNDCTKKLLEKIPLDKLPADLKITDFAKLKFLIGAISNAQINQWLIRSIRTSPKDLNILGMEDLHLLMQHLDTVNRKRVIDQYQFSNHIHNKKDFSDFLDLLALIKEDKWLNSQSSFQNLLVQINFIENYSGYLLDEDLLQKISNLNITQFICFISKRLNQETCIALLSSLTREAGNEAKINFVFKEMSDQEVIQGVLKKQPPFTDEQFQRLCTTNITSKVSKLTENPKEFGAHKDTLTFIIIIERYIKNLEQDIRNHKNLEGIPIKDDFTELTHEKIRIMNEGLNRISTGGIKSALEYLEADLQQKTLSKNRNPTWVKLAQAILTFGTVYLYRMVKTMLGYPVTQAQSQLGLFRKNSDKFKPTPSPKPQN